MTALRQNTSAEEMINRPGQKRKVAFLALGSNLGDREGNLTNTLNALGRHPHLEVVAVSPIYESAAHTKGRADAPPFLNLVSQVETDLSPHELLRACLDIERIGGRFRDKSHDWSPRTIDIDIILFDQETIDTSELRIPHPRLAERRFVLTPLMDIAPRLHVPAPYDRSVSDLLSVCPDSGPVTKIGNQAGSPANAER